MTVIKPRKFSVFWRSVLAVLLAGCSPPSPSLSPLPPQPTCPVYPANPETYCPGPPRAGCVVLSADPSNCGACGHVCPMGPGYGCWQGHCAPPCTPLTNLCLDPTTNAYTCPDLTTDTANCGACAHSCPAGDVCRVGHCHAPTDPYWQATSLPMGTWLDACNAPGSQTALTSTTTGSVTVSLPFAFRFWGTTSSVGATVAVGPLGAFTLPGGWVQVLYSGGLGTRSAGVCVATFGTAPMRQFVVEWSDANYFWNDTGTYHLTFEGVLNEADGTIDMVYQSLTEENGGFTPMTGLTTADRSDTFVLCRSALDGGRIATACPQTSTRIHLAPVN